MEYKVKTVKVTRNTEYLADVYVEIKLLPNERIEEIAERTFKRFAVYACQDCIKELQEIEGFKKCVEQMVRVHFDCINTVYLVPTADIHY